MQTAAIALIVVLLVGMACGLEITWALGLSCIAAVLLDPKLTFVVIAQRIFANSNSFSMLAIPAFMLAGDVMSKGGLSKRLVAFADSLVGWISGGISLVSIVACTFFAARTSSGKPITDRMEVSFTVMMNWLMMLGIMVRIAWGRMIFLMVFQYGRPRDLPASI